MAQLTPSRRSALLQQLLAQMSQTPQGTRTGGEALVRLGTKFLQKMQYDKLREEEMGDNQAVADAIMQGMFEKNGFVDIPGAQGAAPSPGPATANPDGTIDEISVAPAQRTTRPRVNELREQPDINAVIGALAGRPELLNQALPTLGAIAGLQPKPKENSYTFHQGEYTAKTDIVDDRTGEVVVPRGEQFIGTERRGKDGSVVFGLPRADNTFLRIPGQNVQGGTQETTQTEITPSDRSRAISEFRGAAQAHAKSLRQANRMLELATTDPSALGKSGAIQTFANEMIRTAKGVTKTVADFTDLVTEEGSGPADLDYSAFSGLRNVAIDSTEFRGLVWGVAFAQAVREQGSRPTDRDVQAFIDQIGGNSTDEAAFVRTLGGFMRIQTQSMLDGAMLNEIPKADVDRFRSLIDPLMEPFNNDSTSVDDYLRRKREALGNQP